jgi:glycosyltransferase involved in cell wall biosynthesis
MPTQERKKNGAVPARIGINAHLLSAESGYRRAGIHYYMTQILANLPYAAGDAEYTVFTRDSNLVMQREGLQVESSRWPTERRLVRILWEQIAWPAASAKKHFDLNHSMAFVMPVFGRIPTVVTVYDTSFVRYPELFPAFQRTYLRQQTRRSAKHARRLITISEAGKQDLHHYFGTPLDKIDVVLPGVDSQFRPLAEAEIERFRQRNDLMNQFILHVGTLQPRKNIPMLLRALANLRDRPVDLILVGAKGWFYDEIFSEVERLGLRNRVHFPGYVEDAALPFWYNAAKVLVFPSVYEGFGMPIVEAMACGTPVIAAHTSSIPEAGGNAALYFEPQDTEALTNHIATLLEDEVVSSKMSRDGIIHARGFSWQSAGQKTALVYAKALGGQ